MGLLFIGKLWSYCFPLLQSGHWDSVIGKCLLVEGCRHCTVLHTIKIEIHSSYAKTNPKVLSTKAVSGFKDNVLPLKEFYRVSLGRTERDKENKICRKSVRRFELLLTNNTGEFKEISAAFMSFSACKNSSYLIAYICMYLKYMNHCFD